MPVRPDSHEHQKRRQRERMYDASRMDDPHHQFVSSKRWRRVRMMKLKRDPLCADCGEMATEVHHERGRRDAPEAAYLLDNLVSLCKRCHTKRENRARRRGG